MYHSMQSRHDKMAIIALCQAHVAVSLQTVVLDYVQSEIHLKSSRDKSQLDLASELMWLRCYRLPPASVTNC